MNFADQEEIALRKKSRVKKRRHDILWNSLTAIFAVASVAVAGFFLYLYSNPASSLNPYPPPTLPALIQIPTATLTPIPPTATVTFFTTATATEIVVTSDETTAEVTSGTGSVTSTPAAVGDFLFALKGSPVGMANTAFHPSLDCNWQGVAGKVTDIQGQGISNLAVHLTGTYNGETIDQTTLSGGASVYIGDGGYEIVLEVGSAPLASSGQLTIQIEDSSYVPLSPAVTFDTYAECDKNLVLINFQQSQ